MHNLGIIVIFYREGAKQKDERFVMIDKTKLASLAANHLTLYFAYFYILLKQCNFKALRLVLLLSIVLFGIMACLF